MRLVVAAIVIGVAGFASAASSAAPRGTVLVTITTPAGVPANVLVRSKGTRVVAKSPVGKSASRELTAAAGTVRVSAPRVAFDGALYDAVVKRSRFTLRRGATVRVRVAYKRLPAASRLRATAVGHTRVSLAWSAPARAVVRLRRVRGERPPAAVGRGVRIATKRGSAVDSPLKPGTKYSYALFTRVKKRWIGPVTVLVGTAARDPRIARYVAPPSTVIVEPGDLDEPFDAGGAVGVRLAPGRRTPTVGAAFVLPVSSVLPGGFLGKVVSSSADGRTVRLARAGLAEAFDYYLLDVDFGSSERNGARPRAAVPGGSRARPRSFFRKPFECRGSVAVTHPMANWEYTPGGHYFTEVVDGPNGPGATYDLRSTLTATYAVDFEFKAAATCAVNLPMLPIPLSPLPVPIFMLIDAGAEVGFADQIAVRDLGFAATFGFWAKGAADENGEPVDRSDGGTILDGGPTTPSVELSTMLEATVGVEISVGPGLAVPFMGAVAGVGFKMNAYHLTMEPIVDPADSSKRCGKVTEGWDSEINANIKLWMGPMKWAGYLTIDQLKAKGLWRDVWVLPSDCGAPVTPPPPPPPPPGPPPPPHLTITQSAPPGVFPSQEFDFTMKITNTGGLPARDVRVQVTPPTEGELVATVTFPSVRQRSQVISLGTIEAGNAMTVILRWRAPDATTSLTNRATVDHAASVFEPGPLPEASATVAVGEEAGCDPCGVTAAGTGLRNRPQGTIEIDAVPAGARVTRAVLVWAVLPAPGTEPADKITFAGHEVSADISANQSGSLCWSDGQTRGNAADVTAHVGGNGSYTITRPLNGTIRVDDNPLAAPPYTDGATLFVFYNGGGAKNQVLADFTYSGNLSDEAINRTFTGIHSIGGPASGSVILAGADGQTDGSETFTLTGAGEMTLTDIWDGSDPLPGPDFRIGNLWDTDRFDVTQILPAGQTTLSIESRYTGDCIGLSAAVLVVRQRY